MQVKRVIKKFIKIKKEQQELLEKLMDDILKDQVRLLNEQERTIRQFNEADHDLPW
jgi:hypothetical protein